MTLLSPGANPTIVSYKASTLIKLQRQHCNKVNNASTVKTFTTPALQKKFAMPAL
jgi:hypothetical protein